MWWLCNILATASLVAVAESLSLRVELRSIAVPNSTSQEDSLPVINPSTSGKSSHDSRNDHLDSVEIISASSSTQNTISKERISIPTTS